MKLEEMKWFEIWFDDKQSIVEIMVRNMQSDLDAGYDPNGKSIQEQIKMIADYKQEIDERLEKFSEMEEAKINRWCYLDLRRRGAIA